MDEDATCYGNGPRPRPHRIRRGPTSPRKGHSIPPIYGPCLLWPRLPLSATAELLFAILQLADAQPKGPKQSEIATVAF